jgi:histidinol-phosphate aminotransferase
MPGQNAAHAMIAQSNRYAPHDERGDFIKAVMKVEGVPYDHVAPWPGSSDPLCRSVITFCSPTKGLVTANPTFELAGRTAAWLGAPVKEVPLLPDFRHDVKGMLAANPNAGLYYICTPTTRPARSRRSRTSCGCWRTSPPVRWCWWMKPTPISRAFPSPRSW